MSRAGRGNGWENLFWTVFKRSRNAIVLVDGSDRRLVEVNGASLNLLGYTRNELVGHPIWEFVAGDPPVPPDEWQATLAREEFLGEAELARKDGGRVSVQYAAHVEVMTGQQYVLFVVIGTHRAGGRFRRPAGSTGPRRSLSDREREIVHLVALGKSGPEIAEDLHISHDTVRTHVRNAMAKLNARSRPQLVAMALGEGLISP
jgi:PAS domain S-box-containing protein